MSRKEVALPSCVVFLQSFKHWLEYLSWPEQRYVNRTPENHVQFFLAHVANGGFL